MEDRTHFLAHRGWDVNLKGVLSDLPLDLERSHRFRCQRSNAAKLAPMVLTLIDQDVLAHLELVVRLLAIAQLFGPRPLMVQRAEHEGPVGSELLHPLLNGDCLFTSQTLLIKVWDVEEELWVVTQVQEKWLSSVSAMGALLMAISTRSSRRSQLGDGATGASRILARTMVRRTCSIV